MSDFQQAADFLQQRAAAGFSCPMPMQWSKFWKVLRRNQSRDGDEPPSPLILGAWNIDNDATKHHRLEEQLHWADDNGCLDKALEFLRRLDDSDWNWCAVDRWHENREAAQVEALRSHLEEEYGDED